MTDSNSPQGREFLCSDARRYFSHFLSCTKDVVTLRKSSARTRRAHAYGTLRNQDWWTFLQRERLKQVPRNIKLRQFAATRARAWRGRKRIWPTFSLVGIAERACNALYEQPKKHWKYMGFLAELSLNWCSRRCTPTNISRVSIQRKFCICLHMEVVLPPSTPIMDQLYIQ